MIEGLLEVTLDTDREKRDVAAVFRSLLDETCVDDTLVLVQSATAHVADLKCADQLLNESLGSCCSSVSLPLGFSGTLFKLLKNRGYFRLGFLRQPRLDT